ncbi:hypothetical protein J2W49_002023 [Hydrogenophaga palleronii]|uniref:Uncharacterized protein n=1 Tax=Hydrogenophaga palleronii TaxID=65655 RepID=A0ABU1WLG1_9BURK|nr:hypothetical protein [Hydrogenophaga palleronii]MDR7150068.1 hypothetical protein [Hydrogenophaga palleronii]
MNNAVRQGVSDGGGVPYFGCMDLLEFHVQGVERLVAHSDPVELAIQVNQWPTCLYFFGANDLGFNAAEIHVGPLSQLPQCKIDEGHEPF